MDVKMYSEQAYFHRNGHRTPAKIIPQKRRLAEEGETMDPGASACLPSALLYSTIDLPNAVASGQSDNATKVLEKPIDEIESIFNAKGGGGLRRPRGPGSRFLTQIEIAALEAKQTPYTKRAPEPALSTINTHQSLLPKAQEHGVTQPLPLLKI
jgi:hypothetical protein